jgi:hypothetical protein
MRKRKSIPVGTLFMIIILALATLGVGYGLWSKMLYINGTIETGNVNAVFYDAFTDDDGDVDNPEKDNGDAGTCAEYQYNPAGIGSCDPNKFGPDPTRYLKDVGYCKAEIDTADAQKLHITVTNGYPSYYCTVWFDIWNNGSIPVKIQSLTVTPDPLEKWVNGEQVTVALSELACGDQIDPVEDPSTLEGLAQGDIHIHVEQAADPGATYTFDAELLLVQWNEYFPEKCVNP